MNRFLIRILVLAVALVVLVAGTALATPALPLVGERPAGTFLSRGTLSESVHFNTGEVKFQTKAPVDFVVQTITFPAGSSSGWHSHPGVVMVSITSGEMRHYAADCSFETLSAGGAFVESGSNAGLVQNVSGSPVVVHVTYVVPAGTTNPHLRIDQPNPGCPGIN